MDAFKFIAREHERMERAFAKISKIPDEESGIREKIFKTLKSDLEIHMEIEESVLYPLLNKQSELRGHTFAGITEHKEGKDILREMDSMPKDNKEWMIKCNALREKIIRHNKQEEEELFPEARKILSHEEVVSLGRRFLMAREDLNDMMVYS